MPPLAKGKPAQTPPTLQVDVRDEKGRFLPGNSASVGRPKGSRNKLAQDYIDTYYRLFQEGGEQALREVMLKSPAKFLQLGVLLLPQHFKFEHEHTGRIVAVQMRIRSSAQGPVLLKCAARIADAFLPPDRPRPDPAGRS
jgi:hypothetical protein